MIKLLITNLLFQGAHMFKNKSEEYILEVFKDANYTIKNYSKNDARQHCRVKRGEKI